MARRGFTRVEYEATHRVFGWADPISTRWVDGDDEDSPTVRLQKYIQDRVNDKGITVVELPLPHTDGWTKDDHAYRWGISNKSP